MTGIDDYRSGGWDQYDPAARTWLNRSEGDGETPARRPGYWPGEAGEYQPLAPEDDEEAENAAAARFDFDPVPVRARHDGWTPERQRRFIATLAECACIVSAARAVGKSVKSAYALRNRKDAASFRAAWDEALGEGVALVESLLFQRAVKGSPHPVVNRSGEVVYVRDRMENGLLMFLLRHHKPTVYSSYAQRLAVYEDYYARTGNTQFPAAPDFARLPDLPDLPHIPVPPPMPRAPEIAPDLPHAGVAPPAMPLKAEVAEQAEIAADVALEPGDSVTARPGALETAVEASAEIAEGSRAEDSSAENSSAAPEAGPAPEPAAAAQDTTAPDTHPGLEKRARLTEIVQQCLAEEELDKQAEKRGEAPGPHDPAAVAEVMAAMKPLTGLQLNQAGLRLIAGRERRRKEEARRALHDRDTARAMLKSFFPWLNAEMAAARIAEARGEQPRRLLTGEPARQRRNDQSLPYTELELLALAEHWAIERDTSLTFLHDAANAHLLDYLTAELETEEDRAAA